MPDSVTTTMVRIMGDDYPLKSDADPEYLYELARYVEHKIQSIAQKNKLPSRLKSEVLAALLIADDYFSEKRKNAEIENKLTQLQTIIDGYIEKRA